MKKMAMVLMGLCFGASMVLASSFEPWHYSPAVAVFFPVAGGVVLLFFTRAGSPGQRREVLSIMLVFFAVTVLSSGYALFKVLRYDELEPVWSLPSDVPDGLDTRGFWITEDVFVRVRADGVFAYGLKDGEPRWSHAFSSPEKACGTSRSVEEGIGLVSHATKDGACDRVTAFESSTGRPLWTRELPEKAGYPRLYETGVEIGSGSAAVFSRFGLDLLDPRTGAPQRSPKPPPGCAPRAEEKAMALGDGRVAAVFSCEEDASVRLSVSELGTGSSWSATLGGERPLEDVSVLSTDPLVVRVEQITSGKVEELLVFDPSTGNRLAAIPVKGLESGLPVLIGEDRLYTVVNRPGTPSYSNDVLAYSFTGERLWGSHFKDGVDAVHLTASGPVVASDSLGPGTIAALDPGSGAVTRRDHLPGFFSPSRILAFHLTPDRALFINKDSGEAASEVHAFAFGE